MGFYKQIPWEKLSGLDPDAWICVGSGFSREEIKACLLDQKGGFVAEAITSTQDLCLKFIQSSFPVLKEQVLSAHGRQEVLRMLLGKKEIIKHFPELKHLRRQKTFYQKLDRAIQAGRMTFAHEQEKDVYHERLDQKLGENSIRQEVSQIASAYEAWMVGSSLWDLPLLLKKATEILETNEHESIRLPSEIVLMSAQAQEGLEKYFFEVLSEKTQVKFVGPTQEQFEVENNTKINWKWDRWHTLDDAAEYLAQEIAKQENFHQQVVLIPDVPSVRRSITRAFTNLSIPLMDPRDPMKIKKEEWVKKVVLPLKVVSQQFERNLVRTFLATYYSSHPEQPDWNIEINARGIVRGLPNYQGGKLDYVYQQLNELKNCFGKRLTVSELSQMHLEWIKKHFESHGVAKSWGFSFFEKLWNDFALDFQRIGQEQQKAPIRYWLEKLENRLIQLTPPVEPLKPRSGVRLDLLDQNPFYYQTDKVWIFGLPGKWLTGEGVGDYWFSEREREFLAGEFLVRSAFQIREQRKATLKSWIHLSQTKEIHLLDSTYDWDGREKESLHSTLREISEFSLEEPQEKGAHQRWVKSYQALRTLPSQSVQLPKIENLGFPEIYATELDRYSRCPFQSLAASRWRLKDEREPQAELWPDVRGNILHQATEYLLRSRNTQGQFTKTCEQVLKEAWELRRPKGLYKSNMLSRYAKDKLLSVLYAFVEKENEYFDRSQTQIVSLEDKKLLRFKFPEAEIVGRADRIDEHEEGLFVIDFKTSSQLASGDEMLELGYRLQLPFYALAVKSETKKDVIGVQFVQLNRKANRNHGIFFKKYNGKTEGSLTNTRSKKNVFDIEPDEAWDKSYQQIHTHLKGILSAKYPVAPKKEIECRACVYGDLCGKRRKISMEGESA